MKIRKNIVGWRRAVLIVCLLSLFISFFPWNIGVYLVNAEDQTNQAQLEETIKEQLEKLDLEDLQKYINSLEGFNNQSLVDYILEQIKEQVLNVL